MARRRTLALALVLAGGAALVGGACTHDPVPERPLITGSVPGGGTSTLVPTLGPDTIPTTLRPSGSTPGSTLATSPR